MVDQVSTQVVSSFTQDVQMVVLSLVVLSRKWSGTKYGTIIIFTSKTRPNRVYTVTSRPTLQVVFMSIVTDYFFTNTHGMTMVV
jgi:hypothetical protein